MAPLYDPVTTRVFPSLKNDRMALTLNGKQNNLRTNDFKRLAATMGLKAGDADNALADTRSRLERGLETLALPNIRGYHAETAAMKDEMLEIVRSRFATVG